MLPLRESCRVRTTLHDASQCKTEERDGEASGHRVRDAVVDIGSFGGLKRPVLRGRDSAPSDLEVGVRSVIVNETFANLVLGGAGVLGRRIRYLSGTDAPPSPWYEVVGVIGHLGMNPGDRLDDAGVYRPAAAGSFAPRLAVRISGNPAAFIPRLRQIAFEIDPRS